jgi:cytochrome c oxidase subunit II
MIIASAIVLLVIGTIIFHFWSPWYFTEIAADWGMIDTTVDITFLITGIVFVLVNFFMAYCIYKFKYNKDRKAAYEPESHKLETILTIVTTIGVAALLIPGLFVWADFVEPPEDAAEVEVVGQQWYWTFRYPGEDNQFGNVSIRHTSVDNPFGMDPEDPAGLDDVLIDSNVLHVPIDQPMKFLLRSKDVLHDFAVPQFRVKMDLIPGMVTYLWAEPNRIGTYEILCEELCGAAHFAMRGRVVVDEEEDFQAWIAQFPTFGEVLARPEPDLAAGQASYAVCSACHGIDGQGQQALNAPDINGLSSWYVERQVGYFKDGIRGAHPGDVYGRTMAPMMAVLADDQAIRNVSAYVASLPPTYSESSIVGDTERGQHIYTTCSNCHGEDAQGIWSQQGPSLVDSSDWYLVTQLRHFKERIRGDHQDDMFGEQMQLMSDVLRSDQEILDVIAYINTLKEEAR